MKLRTFLLVALLNSLIFGNSRAAISGPPKQIQEVVATAEVVAVARVTLFSPDDAYRNTKVSGFQRSIVPSGLFTLETVRVLQGECPPTIKVGVPHLLWFNYGFARFEIKPGALILVFLKHGAEKTLQVSNLDVPIVPIADKALLIEGQEEGQSIQKKIIQLLVNSLDDTNLRQISSYLLRSVVSTNLVTVLAPHLSDQNIDVRDNVLYCMAVNQQVSAIPLIASLTREMRILGNSGDSIGALRNYNSSKAVPYLNHLLWEPVSLLRTNTILALGPLADRSSIPYLLLTLFDPERQNVNAPAAYFALQRLLPTIDKMQEDRQGFLDNRDAETARLLAWWRDELAGKHPKAENEPPSPVIDFEKIKPEDAPRILNPLLFEKKLELRQQAAQALQKSGDASSIPYLLLALHDPDATVSFLAYRALHRLIETLPPPTGREPFEARREAYTRELFDWWRAELVGQHFAPDPRPAAPAAPTTPAAPTMPAAPAP